MIRGAIATAVSLVGGMFLGVLVGSLTFDRLPGHMSEISRSSLAALPALAGVVAGGAIWGRWMARLSGARQPRRMTWAGALSFGPAFILAGLSLNALEVAIVERGGGPDLPIHDVFTLLFVPASVLVAGIGGLAIGVVEHGWRVAGRLALRTALAAGLAFLLVNRGMDALGWRVGAPGAVERATMVTVLMAGSLGAALAGGAALVDGLAREREREKETMELARNSYWSGEGR